jgi:hypothetical protein
LPDVEERVSHGEPTFFAGKKVMAYYVDNHHNDGRLAVWVPAPAGMQEALVSERPDQFFRPPYVGVKGWIGIMLELIEDDDLQFFLEQAWLQVATTKMKTHIN